MSVYTSISLVTISTKTTKSTVSVTQLRRYTSL